MPHLPTPAYGADAAGLICGYRIAPDAGTQAIDSSAAAARLAAPSEADGSFLWWHFNLAHTGARPWLAAHAALSDEFFAVVDDGLHSTRIERTEQSLIAVINDVHFDFSFEPSDISTLWINVTQPLVVTARRQPLRSVDRLRAAVKDGAPLRSAAELLEHLLRAQADVLVDIVRDATARIDEIEDRLLPNRRRCSGCCSTRRAG